MLFILNSYSFRDFSFSSSSTSISPNCLFSYSIYAFCDSICYMISALMTCWLLNDEPCYPLNNEAGSVTTPVFNCNFSSAMVRFAPSNNISNSFALRSSFTFALFLILFALYPNLNVLSVSLSLYEHIEQHITSVVLLLPPSDSCKIRVSFESLYGTCSFFYDVNAFMTLPSALSDLFMFFASSSWAPITPVFDTFYEPAKSTKYNRLCFVESFLMCFCDTWMMKREWLREERSFIPVKATFLFWEPLFMTLSICSGEPTGISVQFWMKTPFILSSLISSLALEAG